MIQLEYRLTDRNVPILKDTEIDIGAQRLLHDFNSNLLYEPQPLDIESFAEDYLGLNIHYDNLSNNGCIWGTMVFTNSKIPIYIPEKNRAEYVPVDGDTIVIDNNIADGDKEEIFRSSLGHECGHSIYHRKYFEHRLNCPELYDGDNYGFGFAACRKSDIVGKASTGQRKFVTDRDWIEHHAKRFSAAILMPVLTMRMVCHNKEFRQAAVNESPDLANVILAEQVADIFKVSVMSATIRIQQLNLGIKSYAFNSFY